MHLLHSHSHTMTSLSDKLRPFANQACYWKKNQSLCRINVPCFFIYIVQSNNYWRFAPFSSNPYANYFITAVITGWFTLGTVGNGYAFGCTNWIANFIQDRRQSDSGNSDSGRSLTTPCCSFINKSHQNKSHDNYS